MTAPLAQATHVIGVDLGGTKTAAGVVDSTGVVLMSETIPTLNRAGGEAILDATSALIAGLVERAADAGHTVSGVGVAPQGLSTPLPGPWCRQRMPSSAGPGRRLPPACRRASACACVPSTTSTPMPSAKPGWVPPRDRRVPSWWPSGPASEAVLSWTAPLFLATGLSAGMLGTSLRLTPRSTAFPWPASVALPGTWRRSLPDLPSTSPTSAWGFCPGCR